MRYASPILQERSALHDEPKILQWPNYQFFFNIGLFDDM